MTNWRFVETKAQLNDALRQLKSAGVIGIDTETTGLNPHTCRLRLIQIASEQSPTVVIDCFKLLPHEREALQDLMIRPSVKVFQNAKFDLQFLYAEGIEPAGPLFDTMLAAQLLKTSNGPKRVSLKALAEYYLNISLSKEEQTSDFKGTLRQSQLEYAAKDAEILLPLRECMIEQLKENHLIEAARLEFACVAAVAQMEYTGIYLDLQKWTRLKAEYEAKRDTALNTLYSFTGGSVVQTGFFNDAVFSSFNPDSSKQALALLRAKGIMAADTSQQSLIKYKEQPIVRALMEYRHAAKALSAFLYPIPPMLQKETGRLHPAYGQIGAWSGRMSCGSPNIQQIPREKAFRECFSAPPGKKLIIADYSQIELRVIAEITQDARMGEAYRSGEDLHRLTASLISKKHIDTITKQERQAAKAVNFGLVYGMGAAGLKAYAEETYGVSMQMEEAELFRKRFFQGYRGVAAWHARIRRELPGESRTVSGRKHAYYAHSGLSGRYNTPIQGSAADIMKQALGLLYNALKDSESKIIAVVHDEIVLECSAEEADTTAMTLKECMEGAGAKYLLHVPTVAEVTIGDSWDEK